MINLETCFRRKIFIILLSLVLICRFIPRPNTLSLSVLVNKKILQGIKSTAIRMCRMFWKSWIMLITSRLSLSSMKRQWKMYCYCLAGVLFHYTPTSCFCVLIGVLVSDWNNVKCFLLSSIECLSTVSLKKCRSSSLL